MVHLFRLVNKVNIIIVVVDLCGQLIPTLDQTVINGASSQETLHYFIEPVVLHSFMEIANLSTYRNQLVCFTY